MRSWWRVALAVGIFLAAVGTALQMRVTTPPVEKTGPEAALRELLQGPTESERQGGADSWFSAETAPYLRSFRIDSAGVAHVDFGNLADLIPGASSSAGSELLLRELNGTLFRHPEIRAIEYTIEGSCEAFWNWLQYDCQLVRRTDRGGPAG